MDSWPLGIGCHDSVNLPNKMGYFIIVMGRGMSKNLKNQETKSIKNVSRRNAIKTIVGGVSAIAAYNFLPVQWSKPYVESVFLPAHAATSGITGQYGSTVVVGSTENDFDPKVMLADLGEKISDFLVPAAHADAIKTATVPYAFVTSSTITFKFLYGYAGNQKCQECSGPAENSTFSDSGEFGGSSVLFDFQIVSLTQESITFRISDPNRAWEFTRYRDSSTYSCTDVEPK